MFQKLMGANRQERNLINLHLSFGKEVTLKISADKAPLVLTHCELEKHQILNYKKCDLDISWIHILINLKSFCGILNSIKVHTVYFPPH